MMSKATKFFIVVILSCLTQFIFANTLVIRISRISDGLPLGTISFTDTAMGLLIAPHLRSMPPGPHGFHLHRYPSCNSQGQAAGGHFDPDQTNKHLGPFHAEGHLGDLPVLWVNSRGVAATQLLAPRLTTTDLRQHSLIIHQGGDNYRDQPKKLGGGGKRYACAVIDRLAKWESTIKIVGHQAASAE